MKVAFIRVEARITKNCVEVEVEPLKAALATTRMMS